MTTLDNKYKLVLNTIKSYPEQLTQAWKEIRQIKLPENFDNLKNVVVCGMGGSALGARMVKSLVYKDIHVPIEIVNQYHIPAYASDNSLVISYSYSGNTEEAISSLEDSIKRETKIFGITTGGKLAQILKESNLPCYIFDPKNNPSKQPRMAIGYAVGSILSLLSKTNLIDLTEANIDDAVKAMRKTILDYDQTVAEKANLAKQLANSLKNKAVILVASEHLAGCAHTIKNQFNESAKTFSALFDIPELNHHLMEGLTNPDAIKNIFHFLFINSKLYSERVKIRYPLTMEVIKKNGYKYSEFKPKSANPLSEMLEVLVFGSFVVYYLSKNYSIDPTTIPWVDYFKEKLRKV